MSRRRYPQFGWAYDDRCIGLTVLRPVEVARRERVRRQIQRTQRRAARRRTA